MTAILSESGMREAGRRVDPELMMRAVASSGRIVREAEKSFPGAQESVNLLVSLVDDYWEGRYGSIPYWAVGAMVVALMSIIDSSSLVPDILPAISLEERESLLVLCLGMVEDELVLYRQWCRIKTKDGGSR